MRYKFTYVALAAALVCTPAEARPGWSLNASIALARRVHVPMAVFVTRHGVVVDEEWHSYTTPTQEEGPAWTMPQARRMATALMGPGPTLGEVEKHVSWASFPVPCVSYPQDHWLLYESKRSARKVWGLLAISSWFWAESISVSFMVPDDTAGYKLVNGRLITLGGQATPSPGLSPRPAVHPRSKASDGFPSGF